MAFFNQKREGLDCETWNFSWRHKRSVVKKHLKIIFFTVQPFIVKMQFEIWKYLHSKLFLPKYLSCLLHNSIQLVPKILFTSCLQTAWTAIERFERFERFIDWRLSSAALHTVLHFTQFYVLCEKRERGPRYARQLTSISGQLASIPGQSCPAEDRTPPV